MAEDVKDVALYSDDSVEGRGLDHLLARSDIKAVIIALPIKKQPEYIRKVLLAGKHVLSEVREDSIDPSYWNRSELLAGCD